jgi:hypothetical protein
VDATRRLRSGSFRVKLTNLRRVNDHQGQAMCADFIAPDGRKGSACIPIVDYERYGDAAFESEVMFILRELRKRDRYIDPGLDRFSELP